MNTVTINLTEAQLFILVSLMANAQEAKYNVLRLPAAGYAIQKQEKAGANLGDTMIEFLKDLKDLDKTLSELFNKVFRPNENNDETSHAE